MGTPVLSVAAAAVVKAWLIAGNTAYAAAGFSYRDFFGYLTDLDYTGTNADTGWGYWFAEDAEDWTLQIADPNLPATLPNVNYVGGLVDFSEWPAELSAPVTPIYYSADEDNLAVASFAVGAGAIVYVGYDFFPDEDDIADGLTAAWIGTLNSLVESTLAQLPVVVAPVVEAPVVVAPAAAPAAVLAETGSDMTLPLAGGLLLLGLGLGSALVRRRAGSVG